MLTCACIFHSMLAMNKMPYVLNICLTSLLIASVSNLPVYSHHCQSMDREGVFYECYPGELDGEPTVEQCSGNTQHGQHVTMPPCCTDREVAHSYLDQVIIPETHTRKQTAGIFSDAVLLLQQNHVPPIKASASMHAVFLEPRPLPLPLYRTLCSLLL